jgi:hypothetical protein
MLASEAVTGQFGLLLCQIGQKCSKWQKWVVVNCDCVCGNANAQLHLCLLMP